MLHFTMARIIFNLTHKGPFRPQAQAHVERGMISTNYTADMIQPEESPPKPKEAA